jgi:hypothetical protein
MLEAEAKKRQTRRSAESVPEILPGQLGDSRDQAAALVGVSGRYVSDVKRIAAEAPEKLKALEAGTATLQGAKRQMARERGEAKGPHDERSIHVMQLAYAAISRLSEMEGDDPQFLEAMERVQTYVGHRIREFTARARKGMAEGGPADEEPLSIFEGDKVFVPLKKLLSGA